MKKIILSIVAFGLLAVLFVLSPVYKYYNDTYKATTAYAVVPKETPEKQQTKDSDGKLVSDSFSYFYSFDFVKSNGESQHLNFELSGEDVTPLEPGKLVEAKISKKRVVKGPRLVKKSTVPENILKILFNE